MMMNLSLEQTQLLHTPTSTPLACLTMSGHDFNAVILHVRPGTIFLCLCLIQDKFGCYMIH